jgi:hypothetical protein
MTKSADRTNNASVYKLIAVVYNTSIQSGTERMVSMPRPSDVEIYSETFYAETAGPLVESLERALEILRDWDGVHGEFRINLEITVDGETENNKLMLDLKESLRDVTEGRTKPVSELLDGLEGA